MQPSDQPLRSDTPWQARLHRGTQDHRRRHVRALLALAESEEQPAPATEPHPARKLAGNLTTCGKVRILSQAADSGRIVLHAVRCKSRMCPRCGRIRAQQVQHRIGHAASTIDAPKLITLTLTSTDQPLADQVDRLRKCFTRLRRRKAWRSRVRGGISVIEVTYNAKLDQWHPHLHIVADAEYWPQAELSAAWLDVTGDSKIVDIRAVHSRSAVAHYVAKYVSKSQLPGIIPDRRVAEWALAMHGARTHQAFGTLHGTDTAEPAEKPDGPLETLIPAEALPHDADAGDRRAARLWSAILALVSGHGCDRTLAHADQHHARHRSIARRVRAWWAARPETHRADPPRPNRPRGPCTDPHHRTLRLWEDDGPARDPRTAGH